MPTQLRAPAVPSPWDGRHHDVAVLVDGVVAVVYAVVDDVVESPPVLIDIVVVVARRRLFGFGGGRGGLLEWLRTWSFGIHPPTATSTLVSALGNYLAVVGAGRVAVK